MRKQPAGFLVALCALSLSAPVLAQTGKTQLLWLGQSAFRITTPNGKTILIDPFITQNPKTPVEWKDLQKLGKIDVVLVTHGHMDHFGDAATIVKKNHIQMWGPAGLAQTLVSLGLLSEQEAPGMNKSGTVIFPDPNSIKAVGTFHGALPTYIMISQVHAEHSSEFTYVDPSTKKKQSYLGGEPVGFIIKLENGFTIYHMGDTGIFGDMRLIGEIYKPDLLLIPIGGHYTMDPKLAAEATRMIRPKYAIPMHYGTMPALAGTPDEYIQALGTSSSGTQVIVMKPGDKQSF